MLRGYLIEKYGRMGGAYTCARLLEEAGRLGMHLGMVGVHDLLLSNDGLTLDRCDFVLNRYKWGKVKDAVNALADRSYNRLDLFNRFVNKFEQRKCIRSGPFLQPAWRLGTVQSSYEALAEQLGPVLVAKGLESSMGQEIRLVRHAAEMEALGSVFPPEKELLFESFVDGCWGRDYRLFSLRGEAIACMSRTSSGDFRANVALGATVRPVSLTPELSAIAADLYRQTGLDVIGIDLLPGKEGLYLCEVNVMPGLEGIEQASGRNIAGRILEMVRADGQD